MEREKKYFSTIYKQYFNKKNILLYYLYLFI